ncbi:MAG TPA: c-type cytochrome [Thermoanaerobaculia bacterium]|nr:c-type cytochrome [Thermoanaerobaculia bacterium]
MPRRPPAEPIDHHYDIPRLNRAFWWAGAALTVAFLVMIVADYQRDWKTFQRVFLRLDAKLTRESALQARQKALDDEHSKLIGELRQARGEVATHKESLRKLEARLQDLNPKIYLADQQYKFTKASFDAERYKYEDRLANDRSAAPKAKKGLDALTKELDEKTVALATLKKQEADILAQMDGINAKKKDLESAIEKKTAAFRLGRSKYASLQQDTLFQLRNAAILDMINPTLRVQQVQLPDQFINVNFMKIPKVDRCTTCHIGADRKGFEDPKIKPVFRTHPRLHRMVGSESMHPATTFGCTPCHGGRDRATSFWSAGHSPQTEVQEAAWTKKYDWEFDKFNENPVLPLKYSEAGCYRCHSHEVNFTDAPTLDAGMRVVESLGCWGCHRIEGLEKQGLPKVGPSLEKVGSKLARDWTTRWVMNPPSFRANTRMPNFFYLENFVNVSGPTPPTAAQKKMDEDGRIENDTMVNAIVAYLYDRAKPAEVPPVPGKGDATRGQKLLADRGCYGCHLADPNAQRDLTGTYRQFGPNLSGIGSKASRDWIYHWISNPKQWNPDTKMPNLRLSPEDALDIAEYLTTLKAPAGFDQAALPKTDEKTLEQIALYFEMSTKTLFDAKADLAKMDLHAKEVYTGKNLIAHYGCYACHAIPGFEEAKPIGTELTEEGSKAVHRLDFGFIHIPHTRQDWFWTKLHTPRIFDRNRARGWEEKLRMPNFRFSDRELDQAVTTILGFQQLNAAASVVKELSPREAAIERGRRLVKDHNCQGCHVIEGVGGSFRSVVADPSLAPPIIQGEGAKVQSDWLFAFLQAPKTGQIRPWLEVHMPTFGFTDQELNDLTRYFASLDRAEYPFLVADYVTTPGTWGAGKKVFELLKCAKCHPRSLEDMNRPGVDRATLAPNLQMAETRLRHNWINSWILQPDEWMPGTRMPTNFPKNDDGHRISPLGGLIDQPTFAADRAELDKLLGSDEAVRAFLSNPDAVTRALRDYVWSIGLNGGNAPAPLKASAGLQTAAGFGAPPPRDAPAGTR